MRRTEPDRMQQQQQLQLSHRMPRRERRRRRIIAAAAAAAAEVPAPTMPRMPTALSKPPKSRQQVQAKKHRRVLLAWLRQFLTMLMMRT